MDEKKLYQACRQIADKIHKIVKSDSDLWMEDRRSEEVNPFYNQTEQGIFLEFYYGMPSSLWTPWGKWGFGGSGGGHFDGITEQVLKEFDATLHIAEKVTRMGHIGPVYALHKVGRTRLPEPRERSKDAFIGYEEVKEAWRRLS